MCNLTITNSYKWNVGGGSGALAHFISFGNSTCSTAQGSIYDLEYWSCLTCLVKNRRSTTEFLEAPQFADELQQIQDAMRQENKDKRKAENKGKLDEEPMPASDEEDDQPTDPIKTTCTHMVIGETDKPELPFKKDANANEVTKLHDRLMAFKKLAQRKVPSGKCWKHHIIVSICNVPKSAIVYGFVNVSNKNRCNRWQRTSS